MRVRLKQAVKKEIDLICYVCTREVKREFVSGKHHGEIIVRHNNCFPGSDKWLKSEIAKTSEFYKYFK